MRSVRWKNAAVLWILAVVLCGAAPAPVLSRVEWGKSECAYCKMIIWDRRFGAELETRAGEILFFDAIECLAASYYRHWNVPPDEVKAIRFIDHQNPGSLVASAKPRIVRTAQVVSPMGLNLVALGSRSAARQMKQGDADAVLSFRECVEFVRDYWRLPPPSPR